MSVCQFAGHDFTKCGTRRIPCHGAYTTDMPPEPDGTIEIQDYKCEICDQKYSEEVPYSWRKNPDTDEQESK